MQPTHRLPLRLWKNKWFRRLLITGAALIVLLPIAGAVYQWTAARKFERRYPPPGELINVGGHRLHLHRQGSGSPVVVIDAGLAGGSYEWDPLAAEISSVTEVCTYDRAGYGWSDRGPGPRSSQQIVAELHAL
ncbi:MAG: alpha/beta hydrolase, partial [Verrucomicrobiota bacterium]